MNKEITPVITVDGPSGAGKGTVCRMLAKQLGFHYLDSGALYRLLALAAKLHGVDLTNEEALSVLAAHLDVQFLSDDNGQPKIVLEGEVVTRDIRTEEAGAGASKVAAIASVREALLRRQRSFKASPGLVADGRDMGTVVFPQAELKVFLTASAQERAERRLKELRESGLDANIGQILKAIEERDERDRNRPIAPLVPADDAFEIDTTDVSIDDVFARISTLVKQKNIV
ncbi:MAG: (d)CMP kinase [Pseudomonadota bacterium]